MYSNEIVCNILNYIDSNINKKISIDNISNKFNYNKDYLMRLFKKEVKLTIIEYINSIRVYNSIEEIKRSKNNKLIYIALNNGFYSEEYFSETFKKILGISPRIYKKIYNFDRNISEKNYNLYFKNYIILDEKIKEIQKYKNNIKSKKIYEKKLSIFK